MHRYCAAQWIAGLMLALMMLLPQAYAAEQKSVTQQGAAQQPEAAK